MSSTMSDAQKRDAMNEVLKKELPLTHEDLQVLREVTSVAQVMSGVDWLDFRMSVESLDATRRLETAITKLDQTSAFLARVGIAVAGAGVILAVLQVLVGMGILGWAPASR